MSCPICGSSKSKQLLRLNCGNFDQSILYRFVRIGVCLQCGHIYNQLSVQEMVDLIKYYETEYAQINIKSGDKSGDRPGSNSPNALNRYARLYDLINSYANKTDGVLDVGCAAGGFLDFLQKRGFKRRYGIDIIKTYVRQAQSKKAHYIKYGRVESLPFADNSMELLVMDQVLEHVVNLT
ncbi:MAG: class I SAM-dependent methyltransferase, partial [Patescibacteria group bacterium]|nr:class I SAM-dependent methyltransferase [Patescibacteria group bacterium]